MTIFDTVVNTIVEQTNLNYDICKSVISIMLLGDDLVGYIVSKGLTITQVVAIRDTFDDFSIANKEEKDEQL